jgi:ubiquitin carboxyl-terminal hydrolase 7
MIPAFRRAIFQFDLPAKVRPESSVAAQLQQLFFRLAIGANGAQTTRWVTKSFGWGIEEVFQQQDVQELFQKMFEALQNGVASAPHSELAAVLNQFGGKQNSFVECNACGTRNTRPDPFLNLCLNVKGMRSVEHAMETMLLPETLEGANAYR